MAPKMGRPPSENPKRNQMRIRLTDSEREKLEYAARVLGLSMTDVVRHGISEMYEKALKTEQAKK